MILAVISHTEHFKRADGQIVGWGPTVTEINHLLDVFDTIYHIAMIYDSEPPSSALPYKSDNVIFVPLPALGGKKIKSKFKILWNAPTVLNTIHNTLKKVDWFQFRAPTGIGVYVIPFLILCSKRPGWFKYAGNWNQERPPLGYRFQRWLLKQQSRTVTINGSWTVQPRHCLTFENPCLTEEDLIEGLRIGKKKSVEGKLTCCFVGRLENPKGVERIIRAIDGLSTSAKRRIEVIHIVGEGIEINYYKSLAEISKVDFVFHGSLPRHRVFEIYKMSHFFLMPTTASEGFPKAIAEAMNFGCYPIVSNISSIGQYIKHLETGFCLDKVTSQNLKHAVEDLWKMNNDTFHQVLLNQRKAVHLFAFNYYNHRISEEIINKKTDVL